MGAAIKPLPGTARQFLKTNPKGSFLIKFKSRAGYGLPDNKKKG